MTPRVSSDDAGCWIEGSWGQYGIARMVEIATDYGYADAEDIRIARGHLAECSIPGSQWVTDDEVESLHDAADSIESWLNAEVAPPGYYFGWADGEFFLQSESWWDE